MVLDEPCSSSPGDLSGGRRLADSSTKLRVWGELGRANSGHLFGTLKLQLLAVVMPLSASTDREVSALCREDQGLPRTVAPYR